jgi:hypothetical protein
VRKLIPLLVLSALGCASATPPGHEPPTTVKSIDAGQPEYAYPGCELLDGPQCPRSATALCAVDYIRKRRSICNFDDDCELTTLKRGCVDLCAPLAVGAEDRDGIVVEAQAEIDRYCRMGPCSEAPCTGPDAGWVARCTFGFCQAYDGNAPDTGPRPDAGTARDAN